MSDDDRRIIHAITTILDRNWSSEASHPATAREIIAVLRGHGWRPTPARRPEPWQPQPGHSSEPTPEWHAAAAAIRHHPPMNAPATGDDQ